MNKQIRITLIILGIAIALIPGLVLSILSEKVVVGEQLCVDGNNNINLAGIMCEDTERLVPGMDNNTKEIIQWTTGIMGLLIYALALFAKGGKPE